MIAITIFTIIVIVTILIFSSPKFSPIPYFPSQPADIPLIIKALNIRNNQTIFDLGAGDGIIIFNAAKKAFQKGLNTQFVAVEINPVLILVLYLRRLFHPNRKNIIIVRDDIFKINIKDQISKIPNNEAIEQWNNVTVYLYLSPWFLEKIILNIKKQLSKFSVISYMYPLKNKTAFAKVTTVKGKNKIFIYNH